MYNEWEVCLAMLTYVAPVSRDYSVGYECMTGTLCNTHVITPYIPQQTPPNISWLIFKTIFPYHRSLVYQNISLGYILLECLIFFKLLT